MNTKTLHLWFPNLFEFTGGIQTYCRFFLQAIQNIYPDNHYHVFIKHDKNSSPNFSTIAPTQFHFSGSIPLPLRTLVFAAQLIGWGLWKRPNLIIMGHLNFSVAAYWLKRLTNIPYWVMAYGIEAWDIQNTSVIKALHHADLILAISSYTRDRLIKEQNLDPNKIVILPCQFEPSRFQPAPKPAYLLEKYGLRREQPIVLTVARLAEVERYKGYDQILQALPQIRQQIPDIHYILVGKGNDETRIKQLITQLGLQDCVTLAGFIPDEQLCDYYNLCDIFAMPSKKEGFGIVYLEALACGKPVLGGNQDGATDALCHGKLGALVNPDDVDEIAQTIIQILQGTYPNPLMYQPESLRQQVIDIFGFEQFQKTLAGYLQDHQTRS
ncbi:glycosyltransferase [Aphanizomenon sp. UHCC 0183]|uniref:glycosyltransferase n=1 Tax=Aphanizomenon sp. UHCC 0183 TaxID=2590028 RepID=UPI0014486680|nr:glycosyltransferase [Aphanizomenon sp. UHCC 0183]MTJ32268.1 glycosyltransferase family 4 protein [Aphanizomenon sp. UHCC 0183]